MSICFVPHRRHLRLFQRTSTFRPLPDRPPPRQAQGPRRTPYRERSHWAWNIPDRSARRARHMDGAGAMTA